MAPGQGLEPQLTVLETVVLPLNEPDIGGRGCRIRTHTHGFGDRYPGFEDQCATITLSP